MTDGHNPRWRCAGASVIGTLHERAGGKCEDAWSHARNAAVEAGVLGVCVCDGAGSAARGRDGAEVTSRLIAQWLAANFEEAVAAADNDLRATVCSLVKDGLHRLADESELPLGGYACTAVALAVADDGRWLALHLGDGGIVGHVGDEVRVVSAPMKGEFANQTYFVTDADAPENMVVVRGSGTAPRGFALFTDGVEASLVNRRTGQVASPAILQMFGWLGRNPESLVSDALRSNLEEVFRAKSEDDCTLVLAVERLSVSQEASDLAGTGRASADDHQAVPPSNTDDTQLPGTPVG